MRRCLRVIFGIPLGIILWVGSIIGVTIGAYMFFEKAGVAAPELVTTIRDGMESFILSINIPAKWFLEHPYVTVLGLFAISVILFVLVTRKCNSKFPNFFIRIAGWLCASVIILFSIATFMLKASDNQLINPENAISLINGIGIGAIFALFLLYQIFGKKLSLWVNRKLQAHQNAIEMKTPGRSSLIWINILKIFELVFPEILLLSLIILMCSFTFSIYFAAILIGLVAPFLTNIWADVNIRREARRIKLQEQINQTKAIEKILKTPIQ